jgi:hypothetical protein
VNRVGLIAKTAGTTYVIDCADSAAAAGQSRMPARPQAGLSRKPPRSFSLPDGDGAALPASAAGRRVLAAGSIPENLGGMNPQSAASPLK